ncbi:MAG: hypothetical protein U9Q20_05790 [Campylobacterota bacterium]|nr:hypothetical protein [Campylobacterota bacterium]
MTKIIKNLTLATLLTIPTMGFASDKAKDLLVIVTTNDSVTQLMAGVLAVQSKKQGVNVEMLFCGKAADIVIKGSKEVKLKPKGMSPQMIVKNLIKGGTKVGVCPPYLPNANKTKDDLLEGVSVVKPAVIAAKLLEEDTKILSY